MGAHGPFLRGGTFEMKRLLTALASLALVGTLFAGVPAKVAAVDAIQDRYFIVPALTADIDSEDDLYSSVDASSCDDAAVSRPDYEGYDTDVSNGYNDSGYFLNDIINALVAGPVDDGDQIVLCEYGDGSAATYYLDDTITIDGSMGSGDGHQDISIVGEGDVTISGYERETITGTDDEDGDILWDYWNSYDDFYDEQNWGFIDAYDVDLSIENITLEDFGDEDDESAINITRGSLTLVEVSIEQSDANYGAAVRAIGADVSVEDSNFSNNYADEYYDAGGGAIYIALEDADDLTSGESYDDTGLIPSLEIVDTSFVGNSSEAQGGAIYASCANVDISSDATDDAVTFVNNDWDEYTQDTYFAVNESGGAGGAILVRKGGVYDDEFGGFRDNNCFESTIELSIDSVAFSENSTNSDHYHEDNGGAIATYGVDVRIADSMFGGNENESGNDSDDGNGGAVFVDGTAGYDPDIALEYDESTSDYYTSVVELEIIDTNFYQNDAYLDGGAVAANCANVTITGGWELGADDSSGTRFQWNDSGDEDGGALATSSESCAEPVQTTIRGAEFAWNDAYSEGGALGFNTNFGNMDDEYSGDYAGFGERDDYSFTIEDSLFYDNGADAGDGGAIDASSTNKANVITASLFSNNFGDSQGGAIDTSEGSGSLTITGSVFGSNMANDEGGAISNEFDTLSIRTSQFLYNHAVEEGGALDLDAGLRVNISGSTFEGNYTIGCSDGGGAIIVDANDLQLSIGSSTFLGNTTEHNDDCGDLDGGAINVDEATDGNDITIAGSRFEGNSATGDGGAINMYETEEGSLTVSGTAFVDNSSGWNANRGGGAIRLVAVPLTITGSSFTGNSAVYGDGGAIYFDYGNATISGTTFTGNFTTVDYFGFDDFDAHTGGAIYADLDTGQVMTLLNSTFTSNVALGFGGAIDTDDSYGGEGTLVVTGSTFKFNQATNGDDGGAMDLDSNAVIKKSLFEGNTAEDDGGAIWIDHEASFTAEISDSTFIRNTADRGGAVYSDGSLMLRNNVFRLNSGERGGAVYAYNLLPRVSWITGNLFDSNTAIVGGGLHYEATQSNQRLVIQSNRFTKNRATIGGGMLINITSAPASLPAAMTRNQFDGNIAASGGGAAFSYEGSTYRTARSAQQAFDRAMKGNTFAATNRATGDRLTARYGGVLSTTVTAVLNQ
jgi:predicted outer membrane repeat protein